MRSIQRQLDELTRHVRELTRRVANLPVRPASGRRAVGGGTVFPVRVYNTTGAAGDATSPCTWTYVVEDLAGNELGSGLIPEKQRPPVGSMLNPYGRVGLAYYDSAGALHLYDANEILDAGTCS